MKKMPKNDSYTSGEYPEDFCIRVRTPFSPWDTEFSFFASCDKAKNREASLFFNVFHDLPGTEKGMKLRD